MAVSSAAWNLAVDNRQQYGQKSMKLLRAHIENFRCLRDVAVEFSIDQGRNVTLIRAHHSDGKTTLCTALEWALYGDAALAETDHPLVPADGDPESTTRTSVAVDYEVSVAPSEVRRYRIVRSASQALRDGEWHRSPTRVELFSLLHPGRAPVDDAVSLIRRHLPATQRYVRFLNETRCASFTESEGLEGSNAVRAAFQAFGLDARFLTLVGDHMNTLFLDSMRAYTADVGTSRASITTAFQLVMSESDGSFRLAYEQLGGSARHALGIALVLGLMEVSGVEAFSVMDAPVAILDLGPKRATLRHAGQRNAQCVLAMSYDEVHGCEDLLDGCVGRGHTLTNTDGQPPDPSHSLLPAKCIVVCDCDHRSSCHTCRRPDPG